jgi:hypothetical protein
MILVDSRVDDLSKHVGVIEVAALSGCWHFENKSLHYLCFIHTFTCSFIVYLLY